MPVDEMKLIPGKLYKYTYSVPIRFLTKPVFWGDSPFADKVGQAGDSGKKIYPGDVVMCVECIQCRIVRSKDDIRYNYSVITPDGDVVYSTMLSSMAQDLFELVS